MSELTDMIERFLERYPEDLPLEWRRPAKKPSDQAISVMVGDLAAASERCRKLTEDGDA